MSIKFLLKITIILTLLISSLISQEFYINPHYLNKLQKDTRSYKIIKDYVKFLNKIKDEDIQTKINKVNLYINRINPRYDSYNYKSEEYWATPFEFFSSAGGDCEDYVIAKMYSLNLLGISNKDMYMNVVKEKYIGGDHMVLNLHVNKNTPPLVLDNLSTKVLPINKRVDLESVFVFNEYGFYKLKNHKKLLEIKKINLPSYENLKKKEKINLILKK